MPLSKSIWLVEGECGSYYCNQHHPVAVCDSLEAAREIRDDCKQIKRVGDEWPAYAELSVREMPLNVTVCDEETSYGCH